ncbi:MAG: ankyrin repeat domain-containing protein [Candidatus Abyssobacteria bacterium SURF_17]|uniref:Ankyrin repeat domain-containing protein n=1 Tax=Candidatus Abyssobacteria bacterium SURF_17 TaxID=2093361 RepID=A0A419F6R2_9BACT|nr:MAG: ankyrin repeat domain-containing protein [Candidatus Abyssubacteria bacterium SURF_17]
MMQIPRVLEEYINSLSQEDKNGENYLEYFYCNYPPEAIGSIKALNWPWVIWFATWGLPDFVDIAENPSDVNATAKDGGTALMVAAYLGHSDVVGLLIKKGANVDAQDNHGDTALRHAIMKEHSDIVQILLDSGADPNIANNSGTTAMEHALTKKNSVVIEMLEKAGGKK